MHRKLSLAGGCLILFGLAFALLIPGIHRGINPLDEGVIACGAVGVMDGQVLYRDIWSPYSPAQFYAVAGAFKLFGPSIKVERLWDTCVRALLAVIAYLLAARLASRKSALLAWLAVTAWGGYYGFYGYPGVPAIACCFASILAMTIAFGRDQLTRARWLVLSGMLIGIAALFRHDFAIYCVVGQVLALSLFRHLPLPSTTQPEETPVVASRRRWPQAIGFLLATPAPFALSAALVVVPVATYFVLKTPLDDLVYNLFTFPTTIMGRFRSLPYPAFGGLPSLPFYLPFLAFAMSGAAAFVVARRRTAEGASYSLGVLMLIVFGTLSWNQTRVRSDLIHTFAFLMPAAILIPVMLHGIPRAGGEAAIASNSPSARPTRLLPCLAALMLVLILVEPISGRIGLLADPNQLSPSITHGLARASTALVSPELAQAARILQANTEPQERIYVGCSSHDRIFISEPILYFLAERHSATRYHDLHPGVATTARVQRQIVSDLEKYGVRFLVLSNAYHQRREPNESALSGSVTILDEFISSNYLPVSQAGPYVIWKRKGE